MPAPLADTFEQLIEDHKRILYKVCRLYCPNPAARDDLAQEILIQLWRSFPRFDGRCRFSTWMYRIALNVAISEYRSESARTRHILPGDQHLLYLAAPSTEEPAELHELYRFIEALDPLHRALILLHLDGYSYLETAEILGITETNVATKLSRLKARMKQELAERTPR